VLGVDQMPRVLNEEVMESTINLKLSSTQQHILAQDVTRKEIKHAMFSLKNNKALGPDGFNAGFFKRMWHIVGEDVINAVRSTTTLYSFADGLIPSVTVMHSVGNNNTNGVTDGSRPSV
jgi:hypothetical protein